MKKRRLGKTELMVTEIGLGGIPLQRLGEEEAISLLHLALDQGINFIDTARGYTISESYIGKVMKTRRSEVILATKTMDRTYEGAKADIETSLKNLQTDYIDLYQLHLIKTKEDYDQVMGPYGAYRALLEAKTAGKIGHIGVTGHNVDMIESILEPEIFETVQFPYNPVERQGEGLFQKAKDLDIGTIVMKPIAGGAFEKGEVSLQWILQNENIGVIIPGMDQEDQVRKNILSSRRPISPEDLEEIESLAREMGTNFCRRCGYCLPCPQGIDIPSTLLFKVYATRYNLKDWAVGRYENIKVPASACIACGSCLDRCPYDLPIIDNLKDVADYFGR